MSGDKYAAVWVSHSSISDFLKCPRAYFLKNVYRDPKSGKKFQLMSPPLALGQAVHEVVESLSVLPTNTRLNDSIMDKFDIAWSKVTGKKGGFLNDEVEQEYKNRGKAMLRRLMQHPGPIARLAVKIKEDLPYFWLSEQDNIILCGKIDWLEYFPESDSVHIIDFKTGKYEEDGKSLQLPIYHLLVHNCQKRPVSGASYWYLEISDDLIERELPNLEDSQEKILSVAQQIKVARKLDRLKCTQMNGCIYCKPLEKVIQGEAEYVGVNGYDQDIYILKNNEIGDESMIL